MSKRKKKLKQPTPRNHVALALAKRACAGGGGKHGKTNKALRRQVKQALRGEVSDK